MASKLFFIVLLFLAHAVCGQKTKNNLAKIPPGIPTKKEIEAEARNHHCVKRTNKTFSARLKNYPFNISTRIQLVSFPDNNNSRDSLPGLNDTIFYSTLKEVKTLTLAEIDKLTDILFNYGFGGRVHTMSIENCYNPRNAILFLDQTGKPFEFIEICFECNRIRESSGKIEIGDLCDQKIDMLKGLFKKAGIEYGITKGFERAD